MARKTRQSLMEEYFYLPDRMFVGGGDGYDWFDPHGSRRTPEKYRYSYDMFYLWGGDEARRRNAERLPFHTDYHDRMIEWSRDNWEAAAKAVPCPIKQMRPRQASAFLSVYHGKPITCIALCEWCNQSSGYPGWTFMYVIDEEEAKLKAERGIS